MKFKIIYLIIAVFTLLYSSLSFSDDKIVYCPDTKTLRYSAPQLNTVFYYADDQFVVYSHKPTIEDKLQDRAWYILVKYTDREPYKAWTKLYQSAVKSLLSIKMNVYSVPVQKHGVYVCTYQDEEGKLIYLTSYIDNAKNIANRDNIINHIEFDHWK